MIDPQPLTNRRKSPTITVLRERGRSCAGQRRGHLRPMLTDGFSARICPRSCQFSGTSNKQKKSIIITIEL